MQYILLAQQSLRPRTPVPFTPELLIPGFWAIDCETRGVDAADPATAVVGIGLANEKHCLYIDLTEGEPAGLRDFLFASTFVAHNTLFDGSFLQKLTGQWLNWVGCSYALFKQCSTEGIPGQSWSLETAQLEVLGWPGTNKDAMNAALKERGLTKADMWQLPASVLAPYCASDADAAWQLWQYLSSVCSTEPYSNWLKYHQREFLTEVRLLAEQQFRGIKVDQDKLEACRAHNEAQISHSMSAFLTHPDVAHHLAVHNKDVHDAWKASEPPQFTANGKESTRWQQWRDREAHWMEDRGFNPNSKQQLEVLFYDKLGHKPLKHTDTGRRVVDRKVLPTLGEPGKLLAAYNVFSKRRGYIAATIQKSARDGLIHPQFNSVGAISTRLGGSGGWNFQQMPKTPEFLATLCARPGHKLVQADAEALEPTILAEFSRDKTLWSLYGPGAKSQDIYLYVAAKIPALGKEIREIYDPDNPTPEAMEQAKAKCKRQRAIAKTVVLAANYNAGPRKIHETLVLGGIDISLREVREIHAAYWRLFYGVKKFEQTLNEMWVNNEGWIPTVVGTPIAVAESMMKDVNNRFCQTSGHQILQLWIWHIDRLRQERGVEMYPWSVDQHDESVWESPDEHAEAAARVLIDALAATNAELGMEIPIKATPMIADNLAQIKVGKEYTDWLEEQDEDN